MGVETAIFAAVAATASVGSAVASRKAAKSQNRAQRRAASLERAESRISQRRQVRRAIAQQRLIAAEARASAAGQNLGSNSALSGFLGGLASDTAGNIGFSNIQLASGLAKSRVLERGASQAARFGSIASGFDGIAGAATALGSFDFKKSKATPSTSVKIPGK